MRHQPSLAKRRRLPRRSLQRRRAALLASYGWPEVWERSRNAGARLHLRFVTLFAVVAVTPAVVLALTFGALVTNAVENWFNRRVQAVVETSAEVATICAERCRSRARRECRVTHRPPC